MLKTIENAHDILVTMNVGDDTVMEPTIVEKTRIKAKKPKKVNFVLLNDDYTPMDFVVFVLKDVFHKSEEQAYKIMLNVHHNGKEIVHTYSKEQAEQKSIDLERVLSAYKQPLKYELQDVD